MKKLLILLPALAALASCKSTTVVEAPKTPPPVHSTTVVPVPTTPTMTTRESTTIRATEYPATRTRTSTTIVNP
ncbi:MAG TPA: hypothetical protein VG796_19035 [Verrucomicrobiales bacterium]|jgi:hypothetical protein|nr:hypothetical protein [Verrucomicrobiales bacterium]